MPKWGRFLLPALLALSSIAHAAITCALTGAPVLVRSEGLTEQMGDVTLTCSGDTPSEHVTGELYLLLTAPITNRFQTDGTLDMPLTVTFPGDSVVLVRYPVFTTVGVVFQNIDFTMPASGAATIRISNIRGAVPGLDATEPIRASIYFYGQLLTFTPATVAVGLPGRGFAASVNSAVIRCYGSPVPAPVSMPGLIGAGTRPLTVRVTDRWRGALEKKKDSADTGTRVLLRYTGLPAGMRLFVPDAVAGLDATQPTAGGDLALPAAAGIYTPGGNGSLLLSLVRDANADGSGGSLAFTLPSSATTLNGASEIPLTGGAAQVVYEVIDNNPAALESAEIPSFFSYQPTGGIAPASGRVSVVIGPVSNVARASATDPIPRFLDVAPPADCSLMDDCALFPTMRIQAPSLEFSSAVGGPSRTQWVYISNDGGGVLSWAASVEYTTGAGWVEIAETPALGVQLTISPAGLAPGVYEATLKIDAGSYAGVQSLPIKLTVNPEEVQVDSVIHAATYAAGPSVPGSIATLMGQGFAGESVTVTFDGLAAQLLYVGGTQINAVVPDGLAPQTTAQVVVTVDGKQSQPFPVPLAASNPGVFQNGVTNLDGSVNRLFNPADHGGYLIVYATGLPQSGIVTAEIGGLAVTPEYAGPAPTLPGVQQVNLRIPDSLSWVTVDLTVCGAGVCSPPYQVTVK